MQYVINSIPRPATWAENSAFQRVDRSELEAEGRTNLLPASVTVDRRIGRELGFEGEPLSEIQPATPAVWAVGVFEEEADTMSVFLLASGDHFWRQDIPGIYRGVFPKQNLPTLLYRAGRLRDRWAAALEAIRPMAAERGHGEVVKILSVSFIEAGRQRYPARMWSDHYLADAELADGSVWRYRLGVGFSGGLSEFRHGACDEPGPNARLVQAPKAHIPAGI